MRALETCLYAEDLEAAERFYKEVLRLPLHSKVAGRHLFFKLEGSMLLIFNPQATQPQLTQDNTDVPGHAGQSGGHACFAIAPEKSVEWQRRLETLGVSVTLYRWGDRGESLYFKDPAGNVLELAPASIWGLAPERGCA